MKSINKQFRLTLKELGLEKNFKARFGAAGKRPSLLQKAAMHFFAKSLEGKLTPAMQIISTKKPRKPGHRHH